MRARRLHISQRHDLILSQVQGHKTVTVPGMAAACGTSEMTIRRDLDMLAGKGLVMRTHGGATLPPRPTGQGPDMFEPPEDPAAYAARNHHAKRAIAHCAASFVKPQQTIALDIGSTTFELAQLLEDEPLNIFTHSLRIATHLAECRPLVHIPCGTVSGPEPAITGARAVEDLSKLLFDVVFLGVSGISSEGVFDHSLEDAAIKKAMIARARRKIVLLDHSKFERHSVALVGRLDAVDIVITDRAPPAALQSALAAAGCETLIASAQDLPLPTG